MSVPTATSSNTEPKPFLRWAGGKSWLIKHLPSLLPVGGFNNYHEPFLGGGAFYLAVKPQNNSFLSDLNQDLVNTYVALRDDLLAVVCALEQHENTAVHYYNIRETVPEHPAEKAARFIYLNQTSFNGIYRVNLDGKYNVPYGNRSKDFLDPDNLARVSEELQDTQIHCRDFADVVQRVLPGDLVFLDPPYTVSHNKNGFIKYNQRLFSLDDQRRLRQVIDFLKDTGVYYILTNAAHATIAEIFDNGDTRRELSRTNVIGGKKATRGRSTEYLFTNIGAT